MDGQSVLLLKPVLNVLTGPDDALLEVGVQSGGQGLLLLGRQEAGGALIGVARVTEAGESLFAVALDQSVDGDPVVPGHLKDLWHGAAFCEECEELSSASFDGTGTGPVEMPEGVSVMRERSGQRYLFDATIIIYLIGVRITPARRSAGGPHPYQRWGPPACVASAGHSHSMVAGGLPVMSYTTRLTSCT